MFETALCRSQTTASRGKLIASSHGGDETKFSAVAEVILALSEVLNRRAVRLAHSSIIHEILLLLRLPAAFSIHSSPTTLKGTRARAISSHSLLKPSSQHDLSSIIDSRYDHRRHPHQGQSMPMPSNRDRVAVERHSVDIHDGRVEKRLRRRVLRSVSSVVIVASGHRWLVSVGSTCPISRRRCQPRTCQATELGDRWQTID